MVEADIELLGVTKSSACLAAVEQEDRSFYGLETGSRTGRALDLELKVSNKVLRFEDDTKILRGGRKNPNVSSAMGK